MAYRLMLLPDERRSPVAKYGTRRPAPVSRNRPSSNSNSLDLIERDLIACSIVELVVPAAAAAPTAAQGAEIWPFEAIRTDDGVAPIPAAVGARAFGGSAPELSLPRST
jgi:hypothetical protein